MESYKGFWALLSCCQHLLATFDILGDGNFMSVMVAIEKKTLLKGFQNLPQQPLKKKVPKKGRESTDLPSFSLPRFAFKALRGANAIQKIIWEKKISKNASARRRFQRDTAAPELQLLRLSPSVVKHCVAPLLKRFSARNKSQHPRALEER